MMNVYQRLTRLAETFQSAAISLHQSGAVDSAKRINAKAEGIIYARDLLTREQAESEAGI